MTECNRSFRSKRCSRDDISTDKSSSCVLAGTRVSKFKRSGDHDGGSRYHADARNGSPLGPATTCRNSRSAGADTLVRSADTGEEHASADENHVGRLCGIASRGARNEGDWRTSHQSESPIEPILEQPHSTGPPASQTTGPADARIQTIRQRGARRLTHGEHSRRKNPANLAPDSSLHQSRSGHHFYPARRLRTTAANSHVYRYHHRQ